MTAQVGALAAWCFGAKTAKPKQMTARNPVRAVRVRARQPARRGGVGAERRVTVTGRVREQFFVERKKVYRQNLKFFLYIANATRNG